MTRLKKTRKTTLKRLPERGSYDRLTAYAILDEGLLCHVGIADDEGVLVIPMAYARSGDTLLLHGAVASRLLNQLDRGTVVCVCVTLLDGLVLARSVFDHSMNYRSVVAFGIAHAITDAAEKENALKCLTEHLVPNRWNDARQPTVKELAATRVLALPLQEASVKMRSGPPSCPDRDKHFSVWSGVIPLSLTAQPPITDPSMQDRMATPSYASDYRRPQGPRGA